MIRGSLPMIPSVPNSSYLHSCATFLFFSRFVFFFGFTFFLSRVGFLRPHLRLWVVLKVILKDRWLFYYLVLGFGFHLCLLLAKTNAFFLFFLNLKFSRGFSFMVQNRSVLPSRMDWFFYCCENHTTFYYRRSKFQRRKISSLV